MSLLKAAASSKGSSIKMGDFADFYVPMDKESVQKAQDFFNNGMKNVAQVDIAYAAETPIGYMKVNGINIKESQLDVLIKKVQSM